MPLELHINSITFEFSTLTFGRARMLRELKINIEAQIDNIFSDIVTLANALDNYEVSGVGTNFIGSLTRFVEQVQRLPDIEAKSILQKQVMARL